MLILCSGWFYQRFIIQIDSCLPFWIFQTLQYSVQCAHIKSKYISLKFQDIRVVASSILCECTVQHSLASTHTHTPTANKYACNFLLCTVLFNSIEFCAHPTKNHMDWKALIYYFVYVTTRLSSDSVNHWTITSRHTKLEMEKKKNMSLWKTFINVVNKFKIKIRLNENKEKRV